MGSRTSELRSFRDVRGSFFQRLDELQAASWVPGVASVFTSDQPLETYPFMDFAPPATQWIGGRKAKPLSTSSITVTNQKYETSIVIPRDHLRRDKTGQADIRIRELAARVAALPQRLISTLIVANGTSYDGVAFFSGSHASGDNDLTAAAATTTIPTVAEMELAVGDCIGAIQGALDNEGEPMNAEAMDFVVMVPIVYQTALLGALRNDFVSSGASNSLAALSAGRMLTIRPVVNPRLTAATTFYVFRADADAKALIYQEEEAADMVEALAEGSDFAFENDAHKYGASVSGAAALGLHQMAARFVFT